MITKLKKEKLRKLYYKFCSNIQYLFLLTLLTALGVVSLKNMKKISRLEHQINFPLTERIKTIEEKEERGLSFLILKQEPKHYKFEKLFKKYPKAKQYINIIKKAIEENEKIWPNDALLFLCLLRYESNFNKYAVSWVGAGGIAQFMPTTAKEIGENKGWKVFLPDYYYKALHYNSKANNYEALSLKYFNNLQMKKAEKYKRLSKKYRKKAITLFNKYKKELLEKVKGKSNEELIEIDWRFNDSLAIKEGIKHLCYLLKEFKGDVRLALAAYNAGSYKVIKASGVGGIPYIKETIDYINLISYVYKYYSENLDFE